MKNLTDEMKAILWDELSQQQIKYAQIEVAPMLLSVLHEMHTIPHIEAEQYQRLEMAYYSRSSGNYMSIDDIAVKALSTRAEGRFALPKKATEGDWRAYQIINLISRLSNVASVLARSASHTKNYISQHSLDEAVFGSKENLSQARGIGGWYMNHLYRMLKEMEDRVVKKVVRVIKRLNLKKGYSYKETVSTSATTVGVVDVTVRMADIKAFYEKYQGWLEKEQWYTVAFIKASLDGVVHLQRGYTSGKYGKIKSAAEKSRVEECFAIIWKAYRITDKLPQR